MNFTRPQGVPADATFIPPVQLSPLQILAAEFAASGQPLPSWFPKQQQFANVQLATIQSVETQNAHLNINAYQRDQQAAKDWQTNFQRAKELGISTPPQPLPVPKIVDRVVYGKQDGEIVSGPEASTGANGAWMWQEWDAVAAPGA